MKLEIQKALTFDAADAASGMDTYCLCTESGAAHYGGITEWSLRGAKLRVLLNPEAASALGVDGGFIVDIDVPAKELPKIRAGLARVLE